MAIVDQEGCCYEEQAASPQLGWVCFICFAGGHAPHIISMEPFLECFTGFMSEPDPAQ
jgi:hypothetical protein